MILDETSLAGTIENLNDSFFYSRKISEKQKKEVADWLTGRHGLKGSYHGMFAPTEKDFGSDVSLYTGDKLTTGASKSHILGEEVIRALIKMNIINSALAKSQEIMNCIISSSEERTGKSDLGYFCCGSCSAAYYRTLAVGGLEKSEERLASAMETLERHRTGTGRWKNYPFFYTVLALTEIDLELSRAELEYAAVSLERTLKKKKLEGKFEKRRRDIAERALSLL